jgi:hypothetical protein
MIPEKYFKLLKVGCKNPEVKNLERLSLQAKMRT